MSHPIDKPGQHGVRDAFNRRPSPPWVKVCGVTCPEDALAAARLGADFVGLNFYPKSPRFVADEVAQEIAQALRAHDVRLVGVFVDEQPSRVRELMLELALDFAQFHGSESAQDVAEFGESALKAFQVGEGFDPAVLDDFESAWGFLFDRYDPHLKGGTGVAWDFGSTRFLAKRRPMLIAGGIRPGNALEALRQSGAWGVDVCSGVESSPGRKEFGRLERLMKEVKNG